MFELSIVRRYLIPKRDQLSVSIISLISILVISLVVWLILVFFSVTNGLEKMWIGRMTTLTAPLKISPTDEYYQSYFFLVDAFSDHSSYAYKSIAEKRDALHSDPYNPDIDVSIPSHVPKPHLNEGGEFVDPVKLVYQTLEEMGKKSDIQGWRFKDFELTLATLHVEPALKPGHSITQAAYLASFDEGNMGLVKTLLSLDKEDAGNIERRYPGAQMKHYTLSKLDQQTLSLPVDSSGRYGILIPKNYREGGVRLGDAGYISYQALVGTGQKEQRIPILVSGFYDQGVMPIGGRLMIVPQEVTSLIRSSYAQHEQDGSAGIYVHFNDVALADKVKKQIQIVLQEKNVDKYWKIETFREYEFTRDLLQQLQSEKNLFLLISTVIILVACSNIISMLFILVNDKKMDIGILRSMGASSLQITAIFGFCGVIMGVLGSLLGIVFAMVTLRFLDSLIALIGHLQGHPLFNRLFFGEAIPNELSFEALLFVLIATAVTSLIAGLVPAVKACRLKPSEILRAE